MLYFPPVWIRRRCVFLLNLFSILYISYLYISWFAYMPYPSIYPLPLLKARSLSPGTICHVSFLVWISCVSATRLQTVHIYFVIQGPKMEPSISFCFSFLKVTQCLVFHIYFADWFFSFLKWKSLIFSVYGNNKRQIISHNKSRGSWQQLSVQYSGVTLTMDGGSMIEQKNVTEKKNY